MSEKEFDKGYKSGFKFGQEVMLDRVKQAREDIANYSDYHRQNLWKSNPNFDIEQGKYLAYEKSLAILDKLIAESEE